MRAAGAWSSRYSRWTRWRRPPSPSKGSTPATTPRRLRTAASIPTRGRRLPGRVGTRPRHSEGGALKARRFRFVFNRREEGSVVNRFIMVACPYPPAATNRCERWANHGALESRPGRPRAAMTHERPPGVGSANHEQTPGAGSANHEQTPGVGSANHEQTPGAGSANHEQDLRRGVRRVGRGPGGARLGGR